ncbi:MAG TPA: LysM peptidoglycan-binding domain-containing protein [Syntrophorhabdaceae bacterium]|jgi:membrane-bound lytic murein transglycosylase D
MKRLCIAFVILVFLAGCAGTGKVATTDHVSRQQDSDLPATDLIKPSKLEGAIAGDRKKPKSKSKVRFGVPDDDEDITSLLEHDDFKDFDLPIVFNDAVKYYVLYFTNGKKKVFANWLKKSRRYVPMIKVILKEHGLPEDLVYLAMIESGFNPKAYSPAKACGPWQFIYETGGRYGLRVNFWIDERRDPEKSTVAAAKYLTDLFNQFGHWYLAAAGYNAGERRVEKAIEKHNTNDFWELSKYNALPRETREYIPRLIAASIIAKDPERFGFGNIQYDEPLTFVEVKVPGATLLTAIARANSMDVGALKSLNPELLRGLTPPYSDEYKIKLPARTNVERFLAKLETSSVDERKIRDVIVYKVKKKDTVAKVLKKYGVTMEELYMVNECDDRLKIKPGMVLNIPTFSSPSPDSTIKAASVVSPVREVGALPESPRVKQTKAEILTEPVIQKQAEKPGMTRGYHVVKKGETLSGISNMHGVDTASLISFNDLKGGKVYPNMKLRLASSDSRKKKEASPRVKLHTVKKGETLAQISGKYGVSVASIKSVNNLKDGRIHASMTLKIVSDRG